MSSNYWLVGKGRAGRDRLTHLSSAAREARSSQRRTWVAEQLRGFPEQIIARLTEADASGQTSWLHFDQCFGPLPNVLDGHEVRAYHGLAVLAHMSLHCGRSRREVSWTYRFGYVLLRCLGIDARWLFCRAGEDRFIVGSLVGYEAVFASWSVGRHL